MTKLFVIAGHGAGDPGACSDGYSEADLVRKLASKLEARGGSDVQVGDTSVNWYASNYISKGKCPKGVPVIELHMDSAAASAKGGHIIIKSGFSADKYDKALANFIGSFMPGRSETIVSRSNLANPNRAGRMGVNYRLMECGFISNDEDRNKFINQMDELADGILSAFGIKSSGSSSSSSGESASNPSSSSTIDLGNETIWGKKYNRNIQSQLGTTVDGIMSGQSSSNKKYFWAVDSASIKYGSGGSLMIKKLQTKLIAKGYSCGSSGVDGHYGTATIKAHQKWLIANGYSCGTSGADGRNGHDTNKAVAKAIKAGLYRNL